MKADRDQDQISQRLRVGMIGLAVVVLLIGVASAIMQSFPRSAPQGNAAVEIVANAVTANAEAGAGEPLVELGAAPASVNEQVAALR